MTETVITVQGQFSGKHAAERATVTLSVGFSGDDRDTVLKSATDAAGLVRRSIAELHEAQSGAIRSWSSDRINVWAERPWNQDGKQLPPVYHANIGFTATFADFDVLGTWVDDIATLAGVTISGTQWELSQETKARVTAEARTGAVSDAVAKASAYATSLGLETVRAIALADPGMLGDGGSPTAGPLQYDMVMATEGSHGGMVFAPETIEVSATVDARFLAT